jgi:DNA recombination protein RmuC
METVLIAALASLVGLLLGYLSGSRGSAGLRATNALLTQQLEQKEQAAQTNVDVLALLSPLKYELVRLHELAQNAERSRASSAGEIREQLRQVSKGYEQLAHVTQNISTALSRGQTRGQWGEMQLEQMLKDAGMLPGTHYERQVTITNSDGTIRPDLFINFPDQTRIPVDSKFPFDAYWRGVESQQANDEQGAAEDFAQHAKDVLKHAETLSRKKYVDAADGPEVVVLFMPLDSIFFAAIEADPLLQQKCHEKGVILTSPAMFMGLLRSIAFGWRRNELAANARQVSDVASSLLKKLGQVVESVTTLGNSLQTSVTAYGKFVSLLDNSVLTEARKLRSLGVSVTAELDAPEKMPSDVRPFLGKAGELTDSN